MTRRPRWSWWRLREAVYHARWRLMAAIMGRVATDEMRHAALLLGFMLSLGYGVEGVLGHLPEYSIGNELADTVKWGTRAEAFAALEAFTLEQAMFADPAAGRAGGAR